MYPETVSQEPGVAEASIKQESLEHVAWPGPTGSPHSSGDLVGRTKRVGGNIGGKSGFTALKLSQWLKTREISPQSCFIVSEILTQLSVHL